jgi:hypothetical protein
MFEKGLDSLEEKGLDSLDSLDSLDCCKNH